MYRVFGWILLNNVSSIWLGIVEVTVIFSKKFFVYKELPIKEGGRAVVLMVNMK